ncbi:TIGR01906 family membrane protein [Gaiella sp.]|uniref:TIGR01906 family membrane protein n=1 Tax=Gaiella sp. TaxID=2663207 RepID=UPI0032663592
MTGFVVILIALTVTPIFVVNAFRILSSDSFVRHELRQDDFPADRYGLEGEERLRLALTGLRSIQPGSEGIALLERATLPDGSPAFGSRELRHMTDVRRLLGAALRLQLIVVGVLLALWIGLRRSPRWRTVVPRGLQVGAFLTFAIALLAVPVILLGFDDFFVQFHSVFFSGDTWRFSTRDTLLRLYPEAFWEDVSQLAAGIVVLQAVVLAVAATWWLRRLRPDGGAT